MPVPGLCGVSQTQTGHSNTSGTTAPETETLANVFGSCREKKTHTKMQAIEARRAIAAALARQWFGVFMRPKTPADAWLTAGLAGWLEGQFTRTFQGANELAYR